jgi:hypothetical protein
MNTKHLRVLALAMGALIVAMAMSATSALARTPAPGYAAFAGCQSPEESAVVSTCVRSVVKSGSFKMGNKNVPITNPIVVSGGIASLPGKITFNSKGGMSLAKQQVPGGVIGLTGLDWLVNFLNVEALQLFAVTELAGTPEIGESSLNLPIKVHLINPVLGSKCYVGSNSNPIMLNLITGTTNPPAPNKPITGREPEFSFDEALGIARGTGGVFVDNSFSAPGASGCTLTLLGFLPVSINGLVDTASALPAASGTNETIQNIDLEIVDRSLVYP